MEATAKWEHSIHTPSGVDRGSSTTINEAKSDACTTNPVSVITGVAPPAAKRPDSAGLVLRNKCGTGLTGRDMPASAAANAVELELSTVLAGIAVAGVEASTVVALPPQPATSSRTTHARASNANLITGNYMNMTVTSRNSSKLQK
jgi:hypothetical protein